MYHSPDKYAFGYAGTAYDCCVRCVGLADCWGSGYTAGTCVLLTSGGQDTCVQSANKGFYVNEPLVKAVGLGWTVSNGQCGYFYDGGVGL